MDHHDYSDGRVFLQTDKGDEPIEVLLPDGSTVDISTKEGANDFLTKSPNFRHFSHTLKKLRKLRWKKEKSKNPGEIEILNRSIYDLYESIDCIVRNADRETFANKVPKSEVTTWLNHVIKVIQSIEGDCFADGLDKRVMDACLAMFQYRHAVAVAIALEGEFFQVLTSSFKEHKDRRPLKSRNYIIATAVNTLATASLLDSWSIEKIFNKFEESGFLLLIVECTVVYERRQSPELLDAFLAELQCCPGILVRTFKFSKKQFLEERLREYGYAYEGDVFKSVKAFRDLQRRKTYGRILDSVLGSKKESRVLHPKILTRLKGIASLVDFMDSKEFEEDLVSGECSYCRKKANAKLQSCARCDFVFYCSKECQRADWRMHKHSCRKLSKAALDRAFALRMNTVAYVNLNFESIAEEMSSFDLERSELAVEISFMPDENGDITALEDPPSFNVVRIRDYMAGHFPEWFPDDWNTDPQRTWLKGMAKMVVTECKPAFGTLIMYHAGRIHVDVGTMEQYRGEASRLHDIQMLFGTKCWCSPPISICQKCPKLLEPEL